MRCRTVLGWWLEMLAFFFCPLTKAHGPSGAKTPLHRREAHREKPVPQPDCGLLLAQMANREPAHCRPRWGVGTRQAFPASSETESSAITAHAEPWSHAVNGDRRIWLPGVAGLNREHQSVQRATHFRFCRSRKGNAKISCAKGFATIAGSEFRLPTATMTLKIR